MIIKIDPSARFDNTSVSNEIFEGQALSMYAHYTCPTCGQGIRFNKQDLEHRSTLRSSTLPPDVGARIDVLAAVEGLSHAEFLDWECPGCRLAVRVYVQKWAGGRHGDSGANIVAVIEVPP
jgi:hypothetical protein